MMSVLLRGSVIFGAAMIVAAPVMAAPAKPAPKPAGAAAASAPTPAAAPAGPRKIVLSDEGRAIASKVYGAPDPQAQALMAEQAGVRGQLDQLVMAASIDVNKLEALMKQEERIQGDLRRRANDRMITLLRALPEADRVVFVRALGASVKPPVVKAPPVSAPSAAPSAPRR